MRLPAARSTIPLAILASAALALTGCGDDPGEGEGTTIPVETERLDPGEERTIAAVEEEIGRYCADVSDAVATGGAPDPERFERARRAIETLTALARERPLVADESGQTPRYALGDLAENLEGSNCDNRLLREAEEALDSIPAE